MPTYDSKTLGSIAAPNDWAHSIDGIDEGRGRMKMAPLSALDTLTLYACEETAHNENKIALYR